MFVGTSNKIKQDTAIDQWQLIDLMEGSISSNEKQVKHPKGTVTNIISGFQL